MFFIIFFRLLCKFEVHQQLGCLLWHINIYCTIGEHCTNEHTNWVLSVTLHEITHSNRYHLRNCTHITAFVRCWDVWSDGFFTQITVFLSFYLIIHISGLHRWLFKIIIIVSFLSCWLVSSLLAYLNRESL